MADLAMSSQNPTTGHWASPLAAAITIARRALAAARTVDPTRAIDVAASHQSLVTALRAVLDAQPATDAAPVAQLVTDAAPVAQLVTDGDDDEVFVPASFEDFAVGDRIRFLSADNGFGGSGDLVVRTGTVVSATARQLRVLCDPNGFGARARLCKAEWKPRDPWRTIPAVHDTRTPVQSATVDSTTYATRNPAVKDTSGVDQTPAGESTRPGTRWCAVNQRTVTIPVADRIVTVPEPAWCLGNHPAVADSAEIEHVGPETVIEVDTPDGPVVVARAAIEQHPHSGDPQCARPFAVVEIGGEYRSCDPAGLRRLRGQLGDRLGLLDDLAAILDTLRENGAR